MFASLATSNAPDGACLHRPRREPLQMPGLARASAREHHRSMGKTKTTDAARQAARERGKRLEEAMRAKGIGTNELERLIGAKGGKVSRYVRGLIVSADPMVWEKAAVVLDESVEWLVHGRRVAPQNATDPRLQERDWVLQDLEEGGERIDPEVRRRMLTTIMRPEYPGDQPWWRSRYEYLVAQRQHTITRLDEAARAAAGEPLPPPPPAVARKKEGRR
jgi:hypothetical protein